MRVTPAMLEKFGKEIFGWKVKKMEVCYLIVQNPTDTHPKQYIAEDFRHALSILQLHWRYHHKATLSEEEIMRIEFTYPWIVSTELN